MLITIDLTATITVLGKRIFFWGGGLTGSRFPFWHHTWNIWTPRHCFEMYTQNSPSSSLRRLSRIASAWKSNRHCQNILTEYLIFIHSFLVNLPFRGFLFHDGSGDRDFFWNCSLITVEETNFLLRDLTRLVSEVWSSLSSQTFTFSVSAIPRWNRFVWFWSGAA